MAEKTDKDIKRLKNIVGKVPEDAKIRLDQMIQEFLAHSELKEITFPHQLSSLERAYVHYQATKHGLQSSSSGCGPDRRLTLRRLTEKTSLEAKPVALSQESLHGIYSLFNAFPPQGSSQSVSDFSKDLRASSESSTLPSKFYQSRLSVGPGPKVPKRRRSNNYFSTRARLPIWRHQREILEFVEKHQVLFIRGSTGCGKTTQVGQFILDEAYSKSKKVRIICTVPRRIAAVSVSERVSVERGEQLGQTVGYQIRLESCLSPSETLLTYCTSGVLLRSLSSMDYAVLRNTTHIIIDEVHERDRQTDFLLACLRDILKMFPALRLILMGANLNNELFSNYFGGGGHDCPIIDVEGRLFNVQVFYLEDVLEMLRYENHDMKCSKRENRQNDTYNGLVQKLQNVKIDVIQDSDRSEVGAFSRVNDEADDLIQQFWIYGDEALFLTFLNLVEEKVVSVNYQHSTAGVSMLMAVAVRGLLDLVKELLRLGADLSIKSKVGDSEFSAVDWASDHRQHEVLKFLLECQYKTNLVPKRSNHFDDVEKQQRLANYLRSIDEERVDLLLILRLLHQIHINSDRSHAILIFLPGYDEIVTLKHLILTDKFGFTHGSFIIFMLHSNIQTGDQRAAFEEPPNGMRKIVLSTNIAESSLTIEDIVYVIDSGKAKEKSFDSMTCVTQLKSVWISKASVNQRRGRAGRCREGICYHLFSSARHESMAEFPIPEIIRTSLQELCLQARSFIKSELKIEQFFARIPEPPAPIAVKKSVELLITMGALDEKENLTSLGFQLLDFPLEPFLGKALIYAVAFRCLDPILTLVSVISYRDPFQLPSDPRDKQKAQECKVRFARDSFSDHMAYLKAFQDWEKSNIYNDALVRKFCRDNYLSSITFEMVYAIRSQLLGQLRAAGFVQAKGNCDLSALNANSGNWALVKGVLVATLYPNICGVNREKKALYNSFNSKIVFHPSTTLTKRKDGVNDIPTEWIIFDEMTQQGTVNLVKGCTCVSTAAAALFAGSFNSTNTVEDPEDAFFLAEVGIAGGRLDLTPSLNVKINQWITLRGSKATVQALVNLRQMIHDLILKRLKKPAAWSSDEDDAIIQTVAAVLVNEDKLLGFKNIEGIGQWPKLVSGNLMGAPRAGFEKIPESVYLSAKGGNRFFVVETSDVNHIVEIMRNGLWNVPTILIDKFAVNNNEEETINDTAIVFFWVPSMKQFVGSIRLKRISSLSFLSEAPIEIVSTKTVNRQNAEREVGFRTSDDSLMNGLELDSELGQALLHMFS